MYRVQREAEHSVVPWKNGRGMTLEIIKADVVDLRFGWRVSAAGVDSDGPFSEFPGIDRWLVVIDGEGLILRPGNAHSKILCRPLQVVAFAGDVPIAAQLLEGVPPGVKDLNLMVDRERYSGSMTIHAAPDIVVNAMVVVAVEDDTLLEVTRVGEDESSKAAVLLMKRDAILDAQHARIAIVSGRLAVIRVVPLAAAASGEAKE